MQAGRNEVEQEEQLGALGVLRREGKIDAGEGMLAFLFAIFKTFERQEEKPRDRGERQQDGGGTRRFKARRRDRPSDEEAAREQYRGIRAADRDLGVARRRREIPRV